jgi:hypothetical protein
MPFQRMPDTVAAPVETSSKSIPDTVPAAAGVPAAIPSQRMPDTVAADAGYRRSGCRIPSQRMPDTVAADAGYRRSGCRWRLKICLKFNSDQRLTNLNKIA